MTTGLWDSQHQSHAGQTINMVQMLCKVWGVGMFSIVALTTSNILLTLRLMQGRDDGSGGGGCGGIPPIPDSVPHSWTAALSATNHSEYLAFLRAAAINTAPAAPTTRSSPAGEGAGGEEQPAPGRGGQRVPGGRGARPLGRPPPLQDARPRVHGAALRAADALLARVPRHADVRRQALLAHADFVIDSFDT
nr:uncharacterized protein LOC113816819 [Penaeus vannamei]